MPLVSAKCTGCGANLEIDNSKESAICPFCNTAYIVEKAIQNYNISNMHANVVNIYNSPFSFSKERKKEKPADRWADIPHHDSTSSTRIHIWDLGLVHKKSEWDKIKNEFVDKYHDGKGDSSFGYKFSIFFSSKKTAKYITLEIEAYNRVNDVVKTESGQVTGPIENEYTNTWYWSDSFNMYGNDKVISYVKIKRVMVEYTDGTKELFEENDFSNEKPQEVINKEEYERNESRKFGIIIGIVGFVLMIVIAYITNFY